MKVSLLAVVLLDAVIALALAGNEQVSVKPEVIEKLTRHEIDRIVFAWKAGAQVGYRIYESVSEAAGTGLRQRPQPRQEQPGRLRHI